MDLIKVLFYRTLQDRNQVSMNQARQLNVTILAPPASSYGGYFSVRMFWVKLLLIYNVLSHEGSLIFHYSCLKASITTLENDDSSLLRTKQNKTNKKTKPTPQSKQKNLLLHQSFCTCSHFDLSILIKAEVLSASLTAISKTPTQSF